MGFEHLSTNFDPNKAFLVIICGPTGIGKTSVAIEIATAENGEIIGADSMQIYRQMTIGTAKPTEAEQARVPHHMVDVVDPTENFDAAKFAAMAGRIISDLGRRGVLPVVAGGTGLYIKALTRGIFEIEVGDPQIRAELKAAAETKGMAALYRELEKVDPETASRVHPNDSYRVIRALEVHADTGNTMSRLQAEHAFAEDKYNCLKIGLTMDRDRLYERINRRVDMMIDEGLEAEVRGLLDRGLSPDLKAMQSIGYRHMAAYLQRQMDWGEMMATLKRDTRRYAKRQFTWFRADPEVRWFEPQETDDILALVRSFLERVERMK